MIFSTEKSIKDLGDKISKEDREKAEAEIKELKEALEKGNIDDIKTKKEKLTETAMTFATKVYEDAAKSQEGKKEETSQDDDVIEGEFEEK